MTQTYDGRYLEWKGWSAETFGSYTPAQARYFRDRLFCNMPLAGKRIVEIGFGNGSVLGFLRDGRAEAIGVEANAALIERAKAHSFAAYADLGEVGAADAIVMLDVLEHLSVPELEAILNQIADRLVPGGLFVARFPNGDSPFGRIHQNGDITHVTALGKGKVEQLCRRAALTVEFLGNARAPIDGGPVKRLKRAAKDVAQSILEQTLSAIFYNERIALGADYLLRARK